MATCSREKLTFEDWLKEVDEILWSRFGLPSHDDLPDCCYRDWYDSGVSPLRAAARAVRNATE